MEVGLARMGMHIFGCHGRHLDGGWGRIREDRAQCRKNASGNHRRSSMGDCFGSWSQAPSLS